MLTLQETVRITDGDRILIGDLTAPPRSRAVVVFAHGGGSSRLSPRNRQVARFMHDHGLATLLLDLLTADEEAADRYTGHLRFDVELLARRLDVAVDWVRQHPRLGELPSVYFGASTGAAAALIAAADDPDSAHAVVSRGGRPDLAGERLGRVRCPTLLIVGGNDPKVLELNRRALAALPGEASLEVVAGASHLFEEPGALEQVSALATHWLETHLPRSA